MHYTMTMSLNILHSKITFLTSLLELKIGSIFQETHGACLGVGAHHEYDSQEPQPLQRLISGQYTPLLSSI